MTTLASRTLGAGGPTVGAIGLGCWGMAGAYGPAEPERSIATIHRGLELGINLLDTADEYGAGENERLLGRAIQDRRDQVVLASKCGFVHDASATVDRSDRGVNGQPVYIRQAGEDALTRLGVDHIDIYYLHRVDPAVAIEESVGALSELVAAGKVGHIGLSEAAPATIRRAHAEHPLAAVQSEYSLWTRTVEAEVLPTLRDLGIALVPFSPLGRGFLSGAIASPQDLADNDWRRSNPRFEAVNLAHNRSLVRRLEAFAADHDATPAQLALAWLLAQGDDIVPIPGTTRPERLDENARAAAIKCSPDELEHLSQLFAPEAVAGERLTEASMGLVDR
jgi:aryl-alcohol dehydrogenase-like predicted oxidoreductase